MRVFSRSRRAGPTRRRCRPLLTLAAATLGSLACVDDTPVTAAEDATARLAISARVASGGVASTVGIRVSYLRAPTTAAGIAAPAPQEIVLLSREVSVGTGPQQVPVAVDLTRCLADPQRAAAETGCQLRVVLRLLIGQAVADSAVLSAISVRPGQTATVPEPVSLVAVASISISLVTRGTSDGPTQPIVVAGRTQQLAATARDASGNVLNGRSFEWASTAGSVATVNPAGVVSARFPGTTTVTAKSGVATGQLQLAVVAQSLTVAPSTATVIVGQTVQLTATVRDANNGVLSGVPVTWQSSAPARASVNATTGVVTGVSIGTPGITLPPPVTITASGGGVSGTAQVAVQSPPPRLGDRIPGGP